jgi:CheY-like chemotaxis protein
MLFGPKGRVLLFCEGKAMNTSKEETADQSILLVDDDPGILKAVSWLLADEGYQVACTSDGHQALDTLEQKRYRLLITDHIMPFMDGITLLRKAKDLNPGTKVIVMTADQEPKSRTAALALRAEGYLLKPFDMMDLKNQVTRCLQPLEKA